MRIIDFDGQKATVELDAEDVSAAEWGLGVAEGETTLSSGAIALWHQLRDLMEAMEELDKSRREAAATEREAP